MLRSLRSWLAASINRERFEAGMDEEMRFHLDAHADDLVRAGLSPADARRRVRVAFGGLDAAKDDCRRSKGLRWLDGKGAALHGGRRAVARDWHRRERRRLQRPQSDDTRRTAVSRTGSPGH